MAKGDGGATERAEAARVRRRWLTLGEILAIVAVVISGLTFWNSYAERRAAESEHAADKSHASTLAATLLLRATPEHDGRALALAPRIETQGIEGQTLRFPTALGLAAVTTTGDARIERDWFADALAKARAAAGLKDGAGDARLPVLIETRFTADGETRTALDTYAIGYAAERGFLSGTHVRLRGLSRLGPARNVVAGQRAIDRAWMQSAGAQAAGG